MTPIVHHLLGTRVMRGSRIAERITDSPAATGRCIAEAVSEHAVVSPDYSHPFKQSASESSSSRSGSAGLVGARTFPYPWCFAL